MRLVLRLEEMQHRRMDDDALGADRLRVFRQFDDDVHVLVRAGHDRPRPRPLAFLQRDAEERLRSSSDIEKNSPCLPAMKTPSIPRSVIQWRRLARKPASSMDMSGANGVSAAAQMPRMFSRAQSLASCRL